MQRKHGLGAAAGLATAALALAWICSQTALAPPAPLSAPVAAAAPLSAEQLARTRVELKVKESVMYEHLSAAEYFNLPEFAAYSAEGEPLLHRWGYVESSLRAALGELLQTAAPLPGVAPLPELVREWQHPDGTGFDLAETEGAELVLVEYWANWCAPCKLQALDIEAFRARHPERRIALLRIERDVKRLDLESGGPERREPGAD